MVIFKCKMCGGDLNIDADVKVVECDYCGTTQTVPSADNEKKMNLFNRANRLRLNSEFDKAAGIYESIIAEFPQEAEAYWGLCLCSYGIEYVDDPATVKKVPTCHRASFEKLSNDDNFKLAMEYADVVAQKVYRDEAREIERIMDNILSVSKNEKPYDVFICYKETDEKGERTIDSVLAQDVYDALSSRGLKVFFARLSLEDKLGQMYEPYIFAALNSAKVMLSVGTKYEHFQAVWVKNEWSRFLKLMSKDKSKVLIPCYKDMDAYDLPDEFKALQAQDMGKLGFVQDLIRGIEKIVGTTEKPGIKETSQNNAAVVSVDSLLKRAFMFLEDGDWQSANEYCEKVLDVDPENGKAYLGKLMVELKAKNYIALSYMTQSFENNINFKKAVRFGDNETARILNDSIKTIKERRLESIYSKASLAMESSKQKTDSNIINQLELNVKHLEEAKRGFDLIPEWKDSKQLSEECAVLIKQNITERNRLFAELNEQEKERKYNTACDDYECLINNKYKGETIGNVASKVYSDFKLLGDYRDSSEKLVVVKNLLDQLRSFENEHKEKLRELKNIVDNNERSLAEFENKNRFNLNDVPAKKAFTFIQKFLSTAFMLAIVTPGAFLSFMSIVGIIMGITESSSEDLNFGIGFLVVGIFLIILGLFLFRKLKKKNSKKNASIITEYNEKQNRVSEAKSNYENYLKSIPDFTFKG